VICLCSHSPTRALLLERYGVAFVQRGAVFDEEKITATDARAFVYEASKGKLESAEAAYGLEIPLLSADTVIVAADGSILRKAKESDEARRILLQQSGADISIITSLHFKSKRVFLSDISVTRYRFDPFDSEDMERYLESGVWQGKAGACMVEGFCKRYIREVEGLESTAMGLQVEYLLPWLELDKQWADSATKEAVSDAL